MKKLISLTLALVTLLSVATVMTGATDADVAETSATYYVSAQPYENVANATIIGYLGDLDGSKSVSILDATQVQLSLASIIALGGNARLLADVDRSGDISILDATDIQCFLAQIETNSKVAHTLYTKTTTPPVTGDIYEQVVNFAKANGQHGTDADSWYNYTEILPDGEFVSIIYYPKGDYIAISSYRVYFTIQGDDSKKNTFMISANDENYTQTYNTWGYVTQPNINKKELAFDCRMFESDIYSSFGQVEAEVKAKAYDILDECDRILSGKTSQSVYTLFY